MVELNGLVELSGTDKATENGVPSNVGLSGELGEGEERVAEGTQVDIDIDEL